MCEELGGAALILAVLRVRHVALDCHGDRLLHLVADDLAGERLDAFLRGRGRSCGAHGHLPLPWVAGLFCTWAVAAPAAARRCSDITVLRRAILRRTLLN